VIAHTLADARAERLSLYSSATAAAPRMAYSSARRTRQPLGFGARPDGQHALVQRNEHRVQAAGRLTAACRARTWAGADGVAGVGHAQPEPPPAGHQRRPAAAQLPGRRLDAAQPLG